MNQPSQYSRLTFGQYSFSVPQKKERRSRDVDPFFAYCYHDDNFLHNAIMKIIFSYCYHEDIFFKTHLDALQTEPVRVKAFWVWEGFWIPVTVFWSVFIGDSHVPMFTSIKSIASSNLCRMYLKRMTLVLAGRTFPSILNNVNEWLNFHFFILLYFSAHSISTVWGMSGFPTSGLPTGGKSWEMCSKSFQNMFMKFALSLCYSGDSR